MPNQYLKVKLPVPPSTNALNVWTPRSRKRKVKRSPEYNEWLDEVRFTVGDAVDGLYQEVKDAINEYGPAFKIEAALGHKKDDGSTTGIDLDNSLKAIIDVFAEFFGHKLYEDDNCVQRINVGRIPLQPDESPYVVVYITPNYYEENIKLSDYVCLTIKTLMSESWEDHVASQALILSRLKGLVHRFSQGTVQNLSPGVEAQQSWRVKY